MHAQRHQRHPHRAHHEAGNHRTEGVQGVINATNGAANRIANRAEGQQRQWHHNRDAEHRREQVADHQRQDAFKEMLDIGHDPHHEDDRDHRGGIAEVLNRDAEEIQRRGVNRHARHLRQDLHHFRVTDSLFHQLLQGRICRVSQQDFIGGQHVHIVRADQRAGGNHRGERIDVEFLRGGKGHHHR